MAKTLQFRRDTTANLASETGAAGELFVDTSKNTVVVMDGSTAGGHPLEKEGAYDHANAAFAAANSASSGAHYSDSDVDAHLNQSNPTSGYVLSWNGSDYAWIDNAGYTDSDVNTHLNLSSASSSQVLSWNGSDFAWVAQSSGGGIADLSSNSIADLSDVTVSSVSGGNFLIYDSPSSSWVNRSPYILFNTSTSATANSAQLDISGQYFTASDNITFQGDEYVRVWRPSDDTIRIQLSDHYNNNVVARKNSMTGLQTDVIPAYASAYDLGSKTIPWYDLYIDHAIQFGDVNNYVRLVGTPDGLITPTFLIGDLLLDSNTITPAASSALAYYGDLGVLDLNGNLDGSGGHWLHAPTVATENVTTTAVTNNNFSGISGLYGIEFAETDNSTGETRMVFYFTSSGASNSWASWVDLSDTSVSAPGFKSVGDRLYFTYANHYYGQVTGTNTSGGEQNTLRAGTYFVELKNNDSTTNDLGPTEIAAIMGDGGLAKPSSVSWSRSIAVNNITGIFRVNDDGSETAVGWSWAGGLPSDLSSREADLGDFRTGKYENSSVQDYVRSDRVYKVSAVYQKETTSTTSAFVPATTGKEGFVRYNKDETALQVYTDAWKNVSVDVPEKVLFTEDVKDGNGNLYALAGKTYVADGGVNFYWPQAWTADPTGTKGEYYKVLNWSIDNSSVYGTIWKPSNIGNHTIVSTDKILYVVNNGAYGYVFTD